MRPFIYIFFQIQKKTIANNGNILYDENKKETDVRTVEQGRKQDGTNLQMGGGLLSPEPGIATAAEGRGGNVRNDEKTLPEGVPVRPVRGNEHQRNDETAPAGYRPGGRGDERSDAAAPAGKVRRDGSTEGRGSDGMGPQGQPGPGYHQGTDPHRSGLRLETDDQGEQLSFNLFPTETEQKDVIIQMEKDGDMIKSVPSFLVPSQEELSDEELDQNPTSVLIGGRWQTFENAEAANAALDQQRKRTGAENSKTRLKISL